jgi:dephospho-CoA kinase
MRMLKIGLTGGIGSGKTSATQLFSRFNIPVIDADVITHQITQPGQSALKSIAEHFGSQVLNADASLNREYLRTLVFSESAKKQELEAILHPLVYAQIAAKVAQLNAAYCVMCIPLLIETQKTDLADRILVIDCPVELQVERVKNRSQLSDAQICAIIAAQASRTQRLAIADDVIDNSKSSAHLAEQVKKLHNSYLLLSSA